MATLILTTVGTLVGGPIGGAIGALAGQAIDAEIFKPASRQGPRLTDLKVQTSSYGTQIPAIFGQLRVAGTVIWATDLAESSSTSGGKGQPDVTSYSYSVSFAVALSSREIMRVGRIWADGNLLRGAAGDFKSAIGAYRLYTGDADQQPDPLIAGAQGMGNTPAWRGIAYALFEDLQLADFGNRIPSLTFEVIADDDPVTVGAIGRALLIAANATDTVRGDFGAAEQPSLVGYAASGADVGEAVSPLIDAFGLSVDVKGDALSLIRGRGAPVVTFDRSDDLRDSNGQAIDPRQMMRTAIADVPRRQSVRHYDPARDFQSGVQSAERQGAGALEDQLDLPVAIDAADARALAGNVLRRRFLARRTSRLARGWSALALRPGVAVSLGENGGAWRVDQVEWHAIAVNLNLVGINGMGEVPASEADAGQAVIQSDQRIGPTQLVMRELPALDDAPMDRPRLVIAASGDNRAWRPAPLLLRDSGSDSFAVVGRSPRGAIFGSALTALATGSSLLFDRFNSVDVALVDDAATLSPASDADLLGGANICLLGDELVQFGDVAQLDSGTFRLSRLLRGRRGTEWAMARHQVGESFLLIRSSTLLAVPDSWTGIGRTLVAAAQGIGDTEPAETSCTITGHALRPLSPAHVRIDGTDMSGYTISWIRRSRMGWGWADGADAPLAEETESYRVEVTAAGTVLRTEARDRAAWTYDSARIASDRSATAGAPITLQVRQIGTFGAGLPATVMIP